MRTQPAQVIHAFVGPTELPVAEFDFYARYCEMFGATYGADKCPTREQWDAACKKPRSRRLSDAEFDDNQESIQNGGREIYG
jgi:hypothetical protein